MHRGTWIEISEQKILNNIKKIRDHNPTKFFIAVVKANAYGIGIKPVIDILKKIDQIYLAVATLDEALVIREYDNEVSIIVLGPININSISIAEEKNIDLTIHDYDYLIQVDRKVKTSLNIHLKICLSMNRLGIIKEFELLKCMKILNSNEKLKKIGIFSHFSTGSKKRCRIYKKDVLNFKKIINNISVDQFKMIHLSNSITSINQKKIKIENSIRVGIGMYGYIKNRINLEESIKLKSRVVQIRKVKKGGFIGYDNTYKAKKDIYVATIPIGYADGLLRTNKKGNLYINNLAYKIIGNICMDYTMIKVDDQIKVNDIVNINLEDMKTNQDTIYYEVFTNLSSRIERIIVQK